MSGQTVQKHRQEYEKQVNHAIDYILAHLDSELSLQKIAAVTTFSPFHFHRLFPGVMGETLNHFVRRKKLEAAAALLAHTQRSITEIAMKTGFSSLADFERDFQAHYGTTPTQYRMGASLEEPDNGHHEHPMTPTDIMNHSYLQFPQEFEIRDEPVRTVAYYKNQEGFNRSVHKAWENLLREAWSTGIDSDEREKIAILYDDPKLAGYEYCFYDACLTLEDGESTPVGLISRTIDGGKYAVLPFKGSVREIEGAYNLLYGYHLPESGYEPRDSFSLQIISPDSKDTSPMQMFDICIPVKPL